MRERVVIAPEAPDGAGREAILSRGRQRGFRRFALPEGDAAVEGAGEEILRRRDRTFLVGKEATPLPIVTVRTVPELDRTLAEVADGATVAIEWAADRVIPLENAIAHRGGRFRLWTVARTPAEVPAALGALEHGADRVIVTVRSVGEIDTLEALVEGEVSGGLEWKALRVRAVTPAGVGDRVLVDTTSLLRPEEGLLVGSQAACLFHVASEAVGSAFSRPRPFRVNAGAAHSYVLMADGTTRYLAELGPGDAVLVTEAAGPARSVRVGRIKIERRPLVLLAAEDEGATRTIFLQEAETVRVSTATGRSAVTAIGPGETVRAVHLPAARHLGTAVTETIDER
jgi:3-dehydroquinate synthase II